MATKKTGGAKAAPSRRVTTKASKPAPSKPRAASGKAASAKGTRRSNKATFEFETLPSGLVVGHKPRPTPGVKKSRMPSAQKMAVMIEEATVDAYNEEEKAVGWHAMLSEHLELPFTTEVLGVEVQIVEIDLTSRNEIVAVCERGAKRLRVPILDLELPEPPPKGFAWIEAYRQWCG